MSSEDRPFHWATLYEFANDPRIIRYLQFLRESVVHDPSSVTLFGRPLSEFIDELRLANDVIKLNTALEEHKAAFVLAVAVYGDGSAQARLALRRLRRTQNEIRAPAGTYGIRAIGDTPVYDPVMDVWRDKDGNVTKTREGGPLFALVGRPLKLTRGQST